MGAREGTRFYPQANTWENARKHFEVIGKRKVTHGYSRVKGLLTHKANRNTYERRHGERTRECIKPTTEFMGERKRELSGKLME